MGGAEPRVVLPPARQPMAGDLHCAHGSNCRSQLQPWKGSAQVCASSWDWDAAPGVIGGSQDPSGMELFW